MVYIHPYEIGTIIPEIKGLSYYRKFRHYYNCKKTINKVNSLINEFEFSTAYNVIKNHFGI